MVSGSVMSTKISFKRKKQKEISLLSDIVRECLKCGFKVFDVTDFGQRCIKCGKEYHLKKRALLRLHRGYKEQGFYVGT